MNMERELPEREPRWILTCTNTDCDFTFVSPVTTLIIDAKSTHERRTGHRLVIARPTIDEDYDNGIA